MALSGGTFKNLAEVIKLTYPTLIPGVIFEGMKRGNPADMIPFAQANHSGEKIKWLREAAGYEDDVTNIGRGGQTTLKESLEYTEKEVTLKTCYDYKKMDKFNPAVHQTVNNYEKLQLESMIRGVTMKLGDKIIYDHTAYDAAGLQMKGLHAWAADNYGEAWDIDEGEGALSLMNCRTLADELKYDFDFWLMPFCLARRIDAFYQEAGSAGLAYNAAGPLGLISYGPGDKATRTQFLCDKPVMRSDYMLAEQANTGAGSNARAKYTSGTKMYSIFAIKLGQGSLAQEDPGTKVAFGKTEGDGQFFNLEYFDKLEDYIASALRLSANTEMILGSKWAIGRIWDITDAAVTG